MTGGRRFALSSPDWGQDHLSLDAVVAYVDDELAAGAHARARAHLADCPDCCTEVVAQRQARAALRGASGPCLPSSLLRSLRSIPVEAELPPPPPGLGITADGQFVLLRDVPPDASDVAPAGLSGGSDAGARRSPRWVRFGAVSGLAIGALAVGALVVPGAPAPPGQGVLGGQVLDAPAQARLSADPAQARPTLDRGVAATADDPGAVPAAVPAADDGAPATGTDDAVLDPRLRARLDRAPVAFFTHP